MLNFEIGSLGGEGRFVAKPFLAWGLFVGETYSPCGAMKRSSTPLSLRVSTMYFTS